jgi:hypothetical protein
MADKQVAIDITARDNASAAFRSITEEMKKMMDQMKQAGTGASESLDKLSKSADSFNEKMTTASTGGVAKTRSGIDSISKSSKEATTAMGEMGDAVKEKMTYPMQMLTYTIEGTIAGFAALGIAAGFAIQQGTQNMINFTGSVQAGTAEYKKLQDIRSSTDTAPLAASVQTLNGEYGFTMNQSNKLTNALAGMDAYWHPKDHAGANITAADTILGSYKAHFGSLTGGQIQTLYQTIDPNVFKQFSQASGQSVATIQQAAELGSSTRFVDKNFQDQLINSTAAKTGRSQYLASPEGKLYHQEQVLSESLAAMEMPLVKWGTDLTSAILPFTKIIAVGVGAGLAVAGITAFVLGIGKVVKAFGMVEGVVKQIFGKHAEKDIVKQLEQDASAGGGCKQCITCPGADGIGTGGGAGGAKTTAERDLEQQAERDAALAAKAGSPLAKDVEEEGPSLFKKLFPFVERDGPTAIMDGAKGLDPYTLALLAAQVGLQFAPKGIKNPVNKAINSAQSGVINIIDGGDARSLIEDGFHSLFGGGHKKKKTAATPKSDGYDPSHITAGDYALPGATIGTINITIPGAGNPEKVANAVPRNINDQIRAQQQRQTRRTGHPQYATNIAASRVRMN